MSENNIDSFKMENVIGIELLQNFQDKFAKSMGFASIIVDEYGSPVTKPSLYTNYCKNFINSTGVGSKRCAECHRRGGELAALTGKPYIYTCHAGLIDFATPILVNGKLIGTILGGQVLTKVPDESKFIDVAKEIGVDENQLIEALKSVRVISKDRIQAAADVLFLIGNAISKIGYEESMLRDMSKKLENELANRGLMLEESKRCNEMKTQFFSTMSHELKTPLNIIFSSVQLLESIYRDSSDIPNMDKFFKYSNIMKQNCYRLLRLTNNIIDMDKIESGFLSVNLRNSDIINAIEDTVMSIADYAKQKKISVIFDTEIEEKITAFDSEKLERIILNLLSNSVKFTGAGGSIRVNVYDRSQYIIISVKDDGIGIPKDMLNKIFNVFTQVNGTFTRNAEGSGIGLSIVKSLVEMHGWKITVTSEENKGSDFRIKVPIKIADEEANVCNKNINPNSSLVENMKIEFSDIYL